MTMMPRLSGFRDALEALVRAALQNCRTEFERPRLVEVPSTRHQWQRQQQELFGPAKELIWARAVGDLVLDAVPGWDSLSQAVAADPNLDQHFSALVGTAHSARRLQLIVVVTCCVLEPLVVRSRSFEFDPVLFAELYEPVEHYLVATTFERRELAPLLGFDSSLDALELTDALLLRPMTDDEISLGLSQGFLPGRPMNFGHQHVARTDQWCVVRSTQLPKVVWPDDPHPLPTQTASSLDGQPFQALVDRVVSAVRLAVGGKVASGPTVDMQPDPLGLGVATGFSRKSIGRPLDASPAVIGPGEVALVMGTFANLGHPAVRGDQRLGIAIDRLGDAGLRAKPEDCLIDLMVAAEALLLTAYRDELGFRLALNASLSLDVPGVARNAVRCFFKAAYDARSSVVHGDTPKKIRSLAGTSVALQDMVGELEPLMRLAVREAVERQASGHGHFDFEGSLAGLLDTSEAD